MSKNESPIDVSLRVQALVQAIDSMRATGCQSNNTEIITRAEAFFQFLQHGVSPDVKLRGVGAVNTQGGTNFPDIGAHPTIGET